MVTRDMVRLNSRFHKGHLAALGGLAAALLTTAGCGCTGCNLRFDGTDEAGRPVKVEAVAGEYALSFIARSSDSCEPAQVGQAAGLLRVTLSDAEGAPGLSYVLCEEGQSCPLLDDDAPKFLWDAELGRGAYELGSVSVDRTRRLERVCEIIVDEGQLELVDRKRLRIVQRTYRGAIVLEGDEPCSQELAIERRSLLTCSEVRELVGVRP
jgi:hypothetical protein